MKSKARYDPIEVCDDAYHKRRQVSIYSDCMGAGTLRPQIRTIHMHVVIFFLCSMIDSFKYQLVYLLLRTKLQVNCIQVCQKVK
jgi:hypothetical protein